MYTIYKFRNNKHNYIFFRPRGLFLKRENIYIYLSLSITACGLATLCLLLLNTFTFTPPWG
jgi:hypothetical protein